MSLTARIGQFWQQFRDRYLSSLHDSDIPWNVRFAALAFRPKRGDYYLYLADLLQGTGGKLPITDIFEADAYRYARSSRGVLSAHWLGAFANQDGKLSRTFAGTLPKEDVMMIRTLEERSGHNVLEEGLKEMSSNTLLIQKAMGMLYSAMVRVSVPLLVLIGIFVLVPTFTVPELKANFSTVPVAKYPAAARELFALSDFLSGNALLVVVALLATLAGILWSLSHLRGPVRPFFDKYLVVWGIYRDFQAIKFLTGLSLILQKRNNESNRLDPALSLMAHGASPWLSYQINAMRQDIQDGSNDQDIFDVELYGRDMKFYLQDLIVSRGLDDALFYIRPRLEGSLLKTMAVRANLMSAVLLVITAVIGIFVYQLHSDAAMGLQQVMLNGMR